MIWIDQIIVPVMMFLIIGEHNQAVDLALVRAKEVESCERRAGQVKIIACIENPAVIERIMFYLKGKVSSAEPVVLPEDGATPQALEHFRVYANQAWRYFLATLFSTLYRY